MDVEEPKEHGKLSVPYFRTLVTFAGLSSTAAFGSVASRCGRKHQPHANAANADTKR